MAPSTQTAVRLTSFEFEDGFANVEVHTDVEVPKPGEGEVLVRLTHRPVQTSDLSVARGLYGARDFPSVLGDEGVGVVDTIGPNTNTDLKQGDRVIGQPWSSGTWQQYVVNEASKLLPVAAEMDDKTAAQSFANPLTAVGLVETAAVPKGQYLLQAAAGSVLGRMLIQYAKHTGIKTINIVRRPEQVQDLLDIGADAVIDSSSKDVAKRVEEITNGEGAFAGIDPVAKDSTGMVMHSVRKGGTTCAYGALTGDAAHVKIMDLMQGKRLEGFMLPNWLDADGAEGKQRKLDRVQQLLADKVMVPLSGASFPLEKAREAIKESQRPGRGGKVFLES
jgi:NADPH:quinone reductase-like Zn-dependent oxidoreductase